MIFNDKLGISNMKKALYNEWNEKEHQNSYGLKCGILFLLLCLPWNFWFLFMDIYRHSNEKRCIAIK